MITSLFESTCGKQQVQHRRYHARFNDCNSASELLIDLFQNCKVARQTNFYPNLMIARYPNSNAEKKHRERS